MAAPTARPAASIGIVPPPAMGWTRGHPRDSRVERIKQRRVALPPRLLHTYLEWRAHHDALELRLHHPVRAARARQAQFVATIRLVFRFTRVLLPIFRGTEPCLNH